MSAGTLEPRKNFVQLINAFSLLPADLKAEYQLVIVGKGEEGYANIMMETAQSRGVGSSLLLPGHVDEDDLVFLYNQCSLFVFPSLHEGFGLPPLEAMSCGKPTLASNTTSLPEVVGLRDALFDPQNPSEMAQKISMVFQDPKLYSFLSRHSLKQARIFSWDLTGQKALAAIRSIESSNSAQPIQVQKTEKKPILAYVSPLPPEHTGIADYSAELLPELAAFYEIICIVDQPQVIDSWIVDHCEIHSPDWLRVHADKVDRVLYHIGNSHFHSFMFSLLREIPGIVMLHDFFISNMFIHMQDAMQFEYAWQRELFRVHGYQALIDSSRDFVYTKMKYPVSRNIIANSTGVIVHSAHSKQLADYWYGAGTSADWRVVPHLRRKASNFHKEKARKELGLDLNDYITGTFGIMDPTKLNHLVLEAWIASSLSKNSNSKLLFIGEHFESEYYRKLVAEVRKRHLEDRIQFVGRCDMDTFRLYLEAVDVAIQLRTNSRGETSGTVLDCMNYGIPTIINACGSLAEHNPNAVILLPERFDSAELVNKMESLFLDESLRQRLSDCAQKNINTVHNPARCGRLYYDAIEKFYREPSSNRMKGPKRLLLDITATQKNGLRTGIERVARALIKELISLNPKGYRVEPVYLCCEDGQWHYRYARKFTLELLQLPTAILDDCEVCVEPGDVICGLDISDDIVKADEQGFFYDISRLGVKIFHLVYDLLPLRMPQFFPDGADLFHSSWVKTLSKIDGLTAISKSVADDVKRWLTENPTGWARKLNVFHIPLGADINNSVPSTGLPVDFQDRLQSFRSKPTFVMVGTIEPRKGYIQTIKAFTRLWAQGVDANLVIVGSEGWKPLPESMRRTIPETVELIKHHPELNKHLYWLDGISDEYLEKIYSSVSCLIAASEGEGFGLPLIEAAQHTLPIIARDIPVFREVADQHAFYFDDINDPDVLAQAVIEWLRLYNDGKHPKAEGLHWCTWNESARHLLTCIGIQHD
jgi:glycosyltransferase involved in cell wall biosynthesis